MEGIQLDENGVQWHSPVNSNIPLGFTKGCWPAERLLTAQEGLRPLQRVSLVHALKALYIIKTCLIYI
jgi:hypothetical protein